MDKMQNEPPEQPNRVENPSAEENQVAQKKAPRKRRFGPSETTLSRQVAAIFEQAHHPPVRAILQRAQELAVEIGPNAPVTTTLLLFAIAQKGEPRAEARWVGDFLAYRFQQQGDRAGETFARYLERERLQVPPSPSSTPGEFTTYVLDDLRRASTIAKDTTGEPVIRTRHLLAALLVDRPGETAPSGAHKRLREMGIDVTTLRDELFAFVSGGGDRDEVWERYLTAMEEAPSRRVMSFSPDNIGEEDMLGFEGDVLALAMLIAARQVKPPLSIGLFGEWGSGKTFFMRRLKSTVATLAREARDSKKMQCENSFYKRIVQVEFNAWHYVDGNLWASLVEHIFDNLKIDDNDSPTVTDTLQKKFFDNLKFTAASKSEAEKKEQTARTEVDRAQQRVNEAAEEREQRRQELTALRTQNILGQFPVSDLREALAPVLAALHLGQVGDSAADLSRAVHEAESVLREGGATVAPLIYAKDRSLRWMALAASLVVPPLLGLLVAALLDWQGTKELGSILVSLAGTVGAGAAWIRKQTGWVREHMKKVQQVQADYDKRLKENLAANEQKIADAGKQLEVAAARHEAARRNRESAAEAYDQAQKELKAASSVKLLADFIADRAGSVDYRKYLGLIALIREDFEKLSGLIEDENWQLGPVVKGEPPRGKLEKFATLDDEVVESASRINRIVLYIDDLDRCPPQKVVEVLEAVHLLLAFPLFVVVVGVDARWVTRSLQTRYGQLLRGGTETGPEVTIGRATASDYLEKIFQIPFWIEPMDDADCKRMVGGLLRDSMATDEPEEGDSGTAFPGDSGPPPPLESGDVGTVAQVTSTAGGQPGSGNGSPADVAHAPNIDSLVIRKQEVRAMSMLAPLLGRSPRALKRFVNVYRLVKASLNSREYRTFLRPQGGSHLVLFLLAVDSGTPNLASAVFEAAKRPSGEGKQKSAAQMILSVLDNAGKDHPDQETVQKERDVLSTWLQSAAAETFLADRDRLAQWATRVARYSFVPDRAVGEVPEGNGKKR